MQDAEVKWRNMSAFRCHTKACVQLSDTAATDASKTATAICRDMFHILWNHFGCLLCQCSFLKYGYWWVNGKCCVQNLLLVDEGTFHGLSWTNTRFQAASCRTANVAHTERLLSRGTLRIGAQLHNVGSFPADTKCSFSIFCFELVHSLLYLLFPVSVV